MKKNISKLEISGSKDKLKEKANPAKFFLGFTMLLIFSLTLLFSCSKDEIKLKEKAAAENLKFQKLSKVFTSGGKFTTAEILAKVQGTKTGYTIKDITALSLSNVVTVTSAKELSFTGAGSFTATIILQHPTKKDATIPKFQFEITTIFQVTSGGALSIKTGVDKTKITTVSIPLSINGVNVTAISDEAFKGCTSLTSITLPNFITAIGINAFSDCTSLTSITIPNSITAIGARVFYKCSSLTSITIPNSVTAIGDGAFYKCSSLTSITLPNSITTIGGGAFTGCSSLTSITLPNSITTIGLSTFSDCTSLTSITLPNSITTIGGGAFSGCSSLTSITLPNSITAIGDYAFWACTKITSITLPTSITSIGKYSFYGWTKSQTIRVPKAKRSAWLSKLKQGNTLTDSNIIGYE